MDTNDNTLAARCSQLAEAVTEASAWVEDNRDLVRGEREGLQAELRRAGRLFRQCEKAARRKMCAGVFGPSQAGKSYLISALARNAAGTLLADFDGATHDFISEINPEGGKESTGLVTRFTMTRDEAAPAGHPVRLRLLTETDLVKILANTYYADCEHKDTPDSAAIMKALDDLERRAGPGGVDANGWPLTVPGGVSLDEWEDLREYLVKDFRAKPRVQELERSFWSRALAVGPRLDAPGRLRLYSLIWNDVMPFTNLLETLQDALVRLGKPAEAFAPMEALIPRSGSIIDVAMLKGLGASGGEGADPAVPPLELVTRAGAKAQLPRAVVTALTAELTIVMREKPDDYFEHTDLLDFPGYRSRYKIDDLVRELSKPDMTRELFLRGKVAYLFQRYCAERELTSMLLCIGPSNQEVQDLPGVINDWIMAAHGETPESRRGKPKALYFVLTKFDMEFEQKKGAPSVESRWDNRLHASLLDFFGKQHDWPRDWDGQAAFDNMFLLRNPNFRFDAVLNYDAEGRETGIRDDQHDYVQSLEDAFMGSELVARHVADPRRAWDAAMALNDGGIGYIRDKLRPLCHPGIKREQLATTLGERRERLAARLKPFWKTDDKEAERRQKEQFFQQVATLFAQMASTQLMGEFVEQLLVRDHDLYDLYFEAERRLVEEGRTARENGSVVAGPGGPVTVGSAVNADDILADLFGDDASQVAANALGEGEEGGQKPARVLDQAESFAALIESHWLDCLHRLADDPVYQRRYGLPGKVFSQLVSEIGLGAERLGLRERMVAALREAAGYANVQRERLIWKQVSLAANLINAHAVWLGFDPRRAAATERTVLVKGHPVVLFEPPAPIHGVPVIGEQASAYERTWVGHWLRAMQTLMLGNVDFDGQQTINIEQNRRIGEIMTTLTNE